MKKHLKRCYSVILAVITLLAVCYFGVDSGLITADAASWNGTTDGGGSAVGYRTFLQAFGIDYDTYMKWLDDHDADSPNPNYYIGTPYVGFDHRNPRGDCAGAYGDCDSSGVAAMNCTGFVWHVLYKSAVRSGASREQINSLPVMGSVIPTWDRLGVYRIYFPTKEEALASGVLEKGDLLWLYGTKDNHNAIFYGESSDHDRYWHSAGPNDYGRIDAPGDLLGLWVAKVTQPNYIELAANPNSSLSNNFGAKYCIFSSKSEAAAAQSYPSDMAAWDKRIGTIVLNSSGKGFLRTQSAPAISELWVNGRAQTNLSYFNADAKRVSAKNTYYAVQWSSSCGAESDDKVYELTDSGKRTPTGYRIFGFKIPKKVKTPTFSSIVSIYRGVKLSWDKVPNADKYRLYYKDRKGEWTRMAETVSDSYIDTDVTFGNTYTYTIRCVDQEGDFISSFYDTGWKHTHQYLDTPQFTELASSASGVELHWNPVPGAERYRVYYKNGDDWTRMGETPYTVFTDDIVSAGHSYTYTIRAVDSDGDFTSDYNRTGWKYTYRGIETPQFTEWTSEPLGVRLRWNAVAGAVRYRLYYKGKDGDWKRMGETASLEFMDDDVTAGNSYTYTIRALNGKGSTVSGYISDGWSCRYEGTATPQISRLENTSKGVQITWNKVEGASKYRVFYRASGTWKRLGDTDSVTMLDTDVTPGCTYTYTIRCLGTRDNYISSYDPNGSLIQFKK